MQKFFLLLSILILAQGCTSIVQPTASRALVERQFVVPTPSVDSSLSVALSNSNIGTVLVIEDQILEMGNKFFAASGFNCRKVSGQQKRQNIYCLNEQNIWFKVNNVISEYNESDSEQSDL